MAHFQIKAGGPTRGRRRVKKIGMGSGKFLTERPRKRRRGNNRRVASSATTIASASSTAAATGN